MNPDKLMSDAGFWTSLNSEYVQNNQNLIKQNTEGAVKHKSKATYVWMD